MSRIKRLIIAGILVWAIGFVSPHSAWSQESYQAPSKIVGVENWSHVTDTLFRGAQPSSAGYKALQQMGVGIVVDFRDEPREISTESKEVEALGLKFVSIPWSGSDKPSTIQVVQFLDLVRTNPNAKIFVHCKRGADRTGVMVAAYRIVVQHKAVTDAVAEMHEFHYDHFWLPQLERYVQSLPQLLSADPLFAAYTVPKASSGNIAASAVASATSKGTQVETSTRAQ